LIELRLSLRQVMYEHERIMGMTLSGDDAGGTT